MNLNSGILSVKQLVGHFNWINGTGFLIFIIFSTYFILYLRMGPLALILAFTIKNIFQIICMIVVLRSNSQVFISITHLLYTQNLTDWMLTSFIWLKLLRVGGFLYLLTQPPSRPRQGHSQSFPLIKEGCSVWCMYLFTYIDSIKLYWLILYIDLTIQPQSFIITRKQKYWIWGGRKESQTKSEDSFPGYRILRFNHLDFGSQLLHWDDWVYHLPYFGYPSSQPRLQHRSRECGNDDS